MHAQSVRRDHRHPVVQGQRLEDGMQVVVPIGTEVADREMQIDLGRGPHCHGGRNDGKHEYRAYSGYEIFPTALAALYDRSIPITLEEM